MGLSDYMDVTYGDAETRGDMDDPSDDDLDYDDDGGLTDEEWIEMLGFDPDEGDDDDADDEAVATADDCACASCESGDCSLHGV